MSTSYYALALGYLDWCAISSTGELECGSLVEGYPSPTPPPGSFTDVCLDDFLGCALDEAGKATCWGTEPEDWAVEGVANPGPVPLTQLSCGSRGACGLTPDGDVYCWGAQASENEPPGSHVVPPPWM
jgi:hypothetical protein